MGESGGHWQSVLGQQGGGAGEGRQIPGRAVQPERRGETALPDGPAIKGRNTPARLPPRFPAPGKCTSHLGFGLVAEYLQRPRPNFLLAPILVIARCGDLKAGQLTSTIWWRILRNLNRPNLCRLTEQTTESDRAEKNLRRNPTGGGGKGLEPTGCVRCCLRVGYWCRWSPKRIRGAMTTNYWSERANPVCCRRNSASVKAGSC